MAHLLAKHALPRVNLALAIAIVWGGLALAAAVYDIGHMLTAW